MVSSSSYDVNVFELRFTQNTNNNVSFSRGAEMRKVNYHLSLWFLLLAAISFIGNIAMGVGFGVGGCRLTRKLRVLVFDRFMRFSMGMFFNHELSFLMHCSNCLFSCFDAHFSRVV
jgi:ABC-type multidrug transport system fused ATPase/permease subunit